MITCQLRVASIASRKSGWVIRFHDSILEGAAHTHQRVYRAPHWWGVDRYQTRFMLIPVGP